jgi:hypothetical protein
MRSWDTHRRIRYVGFAALCGKLVLEVLEMLLVK